MNKLILLTCLVMSFSLFAQEEAPIEEVSVEQELSEVEAKPNESSQSEFVESKPEEIEKVTEVPEEAPVPKEEFIPPATPQAAESMAKQNIEGEVEEKKSFNVRANHWVGTFSFENTKYEVVSDPDQEFEGRKDFNKDFQEIWGGRLGFGGELYLGMGFITRTMVEGYYMGTLFSRVLNGGAESESVKFAYTKKTSQLWGADATQSLGWMFDFKTKNPFMDTYSYMNLETFVEAGIGRASAYNRINYSWDTGPSGGSQESYKLKVEDDLLNAKIGAGFNLTSSQGFFLILKATVNRFEITNRKTSGFKQENGQGPTPLDGSTKNASIDPIVVYTLGGGVKF